MKLGRAISSLFSRRSKTDTHTRQISDESWLALGKDYLTNDTDLNPVIAQSVAAIRDTISMLPPRLMHVSPTGAKKLVDENHPAWMYLRRPCRWLSWSHWIGTIVQDCLLKGDGYAVIQNDQLIPVHDVSCLTGLNELVYDVVFANFPDSDRQVKRYSMDYILHFRSGDLDTFKVCSRSPLQATPSLKKLAASMMSALQAGYDLGMFPSVWLQLQDQNLPPEEKERIYQDLMERHAASKNYQRPMVTGQNIEIQDIKPNSNKESQMVEGRRELAYDCARAFNIPATQTNSLEFATLANAEAYNRQFHTQTIRPWVVRIESTFSDTLLEDDIRLVLGTEELTHGNVLQRRESVIGLLEAKIINEQQAKEMLDLG